MPRGAHHRDAEPEERDHQRWYDTARNQLGLIALATTLLVGAASAGYAVHDFKDTVEVDTPASVEENALAIIGMRDVFQAEHGQIWLRIETGDSAFQQLNRKMDLTLQVVAELRCYIAEEEGYPRQQCIREQTQRRLDALINRPSE